jgi:H+/Cl- antiporter ClcA
MGGSIAGIWGRLIPGLQRDDLKLVLMCGVSAGFGGVFGTPVAGAVFAVEMLAAGHFKLRAALPCLMAAMVSDRACAAWGTLHTVYPLLDSVRPPGTAQISHAALLETGLLLRVVLAGILFGLASRLFSELTHAVQAGFKRFIRSPILRPVVGGCLVIVLVQLLGTTDYLGLGVTSADPKAVTILSCFHAGGAATWSWFWKILFTAVTIGSGFKGGEVTPLFFIGAALGNTLAVFSGAPADLFAAIGFVSVFAGATNTPLACTIMAVELFGGQYTVCFALSCLLAYVFSGNTGVYSSQGLPESKVDGTVMPDGTTIRSVRQNRQQESSDRP